ncbi:MAG: uroporphyrinogen-III synthase [Archangium sp.]|nr:uroporphyrinogen-III synthase [Archangium sp.]
MATTWLLTRETDEPRADAIVVPCVETKVLPWPFSARSAPGERVGVRGCELTLFTSAKSVAAWVGSNRPPLQKVAALRPATSSELEKHGITPDITAEGGVVALAHAIRAWCNFPVHFRYPTSNAGLDSPEQAEAIDLLSGIGKVDRRVAYEVTAPAGLRESLQGATKGDWAISFASPSAVHHFFAARAVITSAPKEAACLGASTVRAWNDRRPKDWPEASPLTEKVAS